jgi:DNA-binding CsgD family transcriptional regulator
MKQLSLKVLILNVILLSIINAQNDSKITSRIQNKIDLYQFTNQDSCKFYLDKLHKFKNNLKDSTYAKLLNDYGIYYAMGNQLDSALHFFKKSVQLVRNKNVKFEALGLKNIANVYKIKGNYSEAINYLNTAKKKLVHINDHKNLANVFGELSSNYFYVQKYDVALTYCLQSIEFIKKVNDPRLLAIQRIRLGNLYFEINRLEDAKKEFILAFNYFKTDVNEKRNYYRALLNLGDIYFFEKNYEKANLYLKYAYQGLINENDLETAIIANAKIGIVLAESNNEKNGINKIKSSFNELVKIGSPQAFSTGNELFYYQTKQNKLKEASQTYQKLQLLYPKEVNMSSQIKYQKNLINYYEKINNNLLLISSLKNLNILEKKYATINNLIKTNEISLKYNQKILNEVNKKLYAENTTLKIKYWFIVVSLILILCLLFFAYKKYVNDMHFLNEKNSLLVRESKILAENHSIEKRNKELMVELANTKERELASMKLDYINLKNNINEGIIELEKNKNTKAFKQKINSLLGSNHIMQEFKLKFDNIHPDFLHKLQKKYPKLTTKDLDFLMLIKLKMNNKEIANVLAINYETVISKKYLIRKKMNITSENELIKEILEM